MKIFLSLIKTCWILIFAFGVFPTGAGAQQTILNVPSSDVLRRGEVFFQLDSTFKPTSQPASGRFSSFVPRIVAGAGRSVEIGLNVTGNIQPGADRTTLVPTVKWRLYNSEKSGVQIVAGDNVFIPVRNRSYRIGNYAYLQVSKSFKSRTRLTAGGYHFSRNVAAPDASRAGGQFGFEQTVNDKFGIAADYYTGRHSFGYFTPGINFKLHPRVTGYLGYSIGNADARQGNHFVFASIGINLR